MVSAQEKKAIEGRIAPLIEQDQNNALGSTKYSKSKEAMVQPVILTIDRYATVSGFLHIPARWEAHCKKSSITKTAVVMLSDGNGGLLGPSGIYASLAIILAEEHKMPVLRLEHRNPGVNYALKTSSRVEGAAFSGVEAAIAYLESTLKTDKFVFVGWSYGAEIAIASAAANKDKIVAVVGIACKNRDECLGAVIRRLYPDPVLLIHGADDTVVRASNSKDLEEAYNKQGKKANKGNLMLKLMLNDGHELSKSCIEVEDLIREFCIAVRDGSMPVWE